MTFKLLALVLLAARQLYWLIAEVQANRVKPKLHHLSFSELCKRLVTTSVGGLILFQLLGWQVWPFTSHALVQTLGFLIVGFSVFISIWARREIGANWAHAAEYQIKKDHQLVDSGIYSYIRHPIYSSIFLSIIGAELVVGSYLVFVFSSVIPIVIYFQAKQEERILIDKFGDKYRKYMKKSKMFIPIIW